MPLVKPSSRRYRGYHRRIFDVIFKAHRNLTNKKPEELINK